jgi:hypothetical protein
MEEDFYATIKLNSGEEIFAKVAPSIEEDRTFLILSHPITMKEIKNRSGLIGYKIEPWLKTTSEDMFIINLDSVITLSESFDIKMISMYQLYIRDSHKETNNQSKLTRSMGYISNVKDAKEILEKLYKKS